MQPIDPAAYDAIGDAYVNRLDISPVHTHYARPATLALLGDVAGQRVLDAGCGDGWYARQLAGLGATVSAIDGSEAMLAHARANSPAAIDFRQADLGSPLPFGDAAFDLVLSALAIHYVQDYRALFAEFARVLRPGGSVVLSTHHVVDEVQRQKPENYFATELFEDTWKGVGNVRFWRRPLSELLQPLLDAGFAFERIVEPQPVTSLQTIDPALYAELSTKPLFLLLRATRC